MPSVKTTLYEKALEVNGKDFRIDKAIEEMAELTKALLDMKYGRPHNSEEEFIDVEITLGIVKLILDSDKIEEFRPKKQAKLYKAIIVGEE